MCRRGCNHQYEQYCTPAQGTLSACISSHREAAMACAADATLATSAIIITSCNYVCSELRTAQMQATFIRASLASWSTCQPRGPLIMASCLIHAHHTNISSCSCQLQVRHPAHQLLLLPKIGTSNGCKRVEARQLGVVRGWEAAT